MRFVLLVLLMFPLATAAQSIHCALEQGGDEAAMSVRAEPDALGGTFQEIGRFKVRAVFAAPPGRTPWLLVEVHARAADGDQRIISSQKVLAPFATGRMEVVEPRMGRMLSYQCGAAQ